MRRRLALPCTTTLITVLLVGCPKRVGSQTGTETDPQTAARIEEARKQAEAGHPEEAQKILSEVGQAQSPELGDALFTLGEAQFKAGDFEKAKDSYQKLLAQFPLYPSANIAKQHLGESLLALKDYREALQTLAPLYPQLPADEKPNAAVKLAQAAENAKAWGEAARWHAEAYVQARDEKTQTAELQKVVDLLESKVPFLDVAKLAQETPTDSPLWPVVQYKLARIYYHLRDWGNLKTTLDALVEKAPQSPWAAQARDLQAKVAKRDQVKPEVLGVVLPMSGKYIRFGESIMAGIKLGLGDRVKLVVKDSAGDPAQARKAVSELIEDEQVIAILGPVLTDESDDAATEAEIGETPILTMTRAENITQKGNWVFRNMLTYSAQAKAVADYALKARGFRKFGVVYPTMPYGQELANYFWDEVLANDGEIRAAETYDPDQTTFSAVAKRLVGRFYLEERDDYRAKRREIIDTVKDPYRQRRAFEDMKKRLEPIVDFEALFIPDYYKNVGLITPALAVEDIITNGCDKRDVERIAKTAGKDAKDIKTVLLLGASGWNFQELVDRAGKFVDCSVFADGFFANSDRKDTRAFVADYRKAYGKDPTLLEAVGYDSARILRTVMEKEKPQTRAAFRESLLKVKDFPGATGKTSINAQREAEKNLFMLTIDRGQIRELDTDVKS